MTALDRDDHQHETTLKDLSYNLGKLKHLLFEGSAEDEKTLAIDDIVVGGGVGMRETGKGETKVGFIRTHIRHASWDM